MYQCSKKLATCKEHCCFNYSDVPAHPMFTSDICWGSLGTSVFGNSSSVAINTQSRLPSRLSFRFLWLCKYTCTIRMVCTQHLCLWRCLWPLKMYRGKDCVEKFVEYTEEEIKRLYEAFPWQSMAMLIDVLKREHEAAEKCHICLKEFNDPENRKVRDHCHYTGLYRGAAHNNCNLKYRIPDHIPLCFTTWVVMTLICLSRN